MLGPGDQLPQLAHHLAAVAGAEGESVAAREKRAELVPRACVEQDGLRPARARPEDVSVGESSARGEALEPGEGNPGRGDVAHVNVVRVESGPIERRSHFDLTVDSLLAQDRDLRPRTSCDEGRGDVVGGIERRRGRQARILAIENSIELFLGATGFVAQLLHPESHLRPRALQMRARCGEYRLRVAHETQLIARVGAADDARRQSR